MTRCLIARISGQNGGTGRYASLPCTTKRRTTTNLKTKNNQNCQKIKFYGSLTTKELKKKHMSIPVGGAEMGRKDLWQGGNWRTRQGGGWQTGRSHFHVWVNQEEQQITQPRVPAWGNKASKPQIESVVSVVSLGDTPNLTGEFIGETHRILEHTQTHLPRNQHQ